MKYYSNFCLLFLVVLMISCSKQEITSNHELPNFGNHVFFENLDSKSEFLSMPRETQKQAWIIKLEKHQNFNLNGDQHEIISNMVSILKGFDKGVFYLSEDLRQMAIEMAKITPEEDFLNLFVRLNSMPEITNSGEKCIKCLEELENYQPIIIDNNSASQRAIDCNCSWVCEPLVGPAPPCSGVIQACSGTSTSNCCNATTSGCGFLGLFGCDQAGVIDCDLFP